MGGFLGIGHSSAKTDRANQLAGINAEWNVYNRGLPMADEFKAAGDITTGKGITGLDEAKKYWQDILSGNRSAVAAATAPEVNAALDISDAAKRQAATTGTARGGGTATANAQVETERMRQMNDLIAKQRPIAARQVESVAGKEADIGARQLAQALQALGLSKGVADEIVNSSIQSRPISMQANAAVQNQIGQALGTAILFGMGARGGGGFTGGLKEIGF